jgi:dsRNA-specific ribonuclease
LALNHGQTLSVRELIAAVWGDRAPLWAASALHTYAARLRRALGPRGGALISEGEGYVLRLGPDDSLDADEATELAARAWEHAAAGEQAEAHALYGQALVLWDAEALAGIPGPVAEHHRTRLARLRLSLAERRERLAGGHSATAEAEPDASSVHRALEERLGWRVEPTLLERALTHRSYAIENGGLPTNERLEFLGDSVLGLVITDTLYRSFPNLSEGQLAKRRAAVLNARALADVARSLDLGAFIRLGRGEELSGGRSKTSILADALEAVIGAVYLGRGQSAADELVHRLFDPLIDTASNPGIGLDFKTASKN